MPLSRSIPTYHDCRQVLDAAIAAGGGKYTLPSHGKAVHWRMRAYTLRTLLHEQAQTASIIPGMTVVTPYDHLELLLPKKGAQGDNTITIRPSIAKGVLSSLDGSPLALAQPEPILDELDLEARDLLEKRG